MAKAGKRVALVTGGTRGLGRSTAEHLLAQGWDVAVCGRREPEHPVQEAGATAWSTVADVRDAAVAEKLVADVVARFGRLDLLVNNAGGSPFNNLVDSSPKLMDRVVALNLLAPLYLSRAAYPALRDSGGGVVNIASISGTRPSPGTTAYGAAKAGLISATKSLAMEWGAAVRINAIVVGLVEDIEQVEHYGGESGIARISAALPMGRMVRGSDLGPIISWLASDAAKFLSGAEIALHSGGEAPPHLLLGQSG
jgi:NAD(P)-dependent dehydrogenase (short-subunit alcohol dehydrogenase family)